jgi:hypothetical protein
MEVTYAVIPEHYAQFQRFLFRKKARLKPWLRVVLILLTLAAIPYLIFLSQFGFWMIALAPFLFFIVFFLVFPLLMPLSASAAAKWLPECLGLHTTSITPEALVHRTGGTETKRQWSVVREIAEDDQMLYFLLTPRSAVMLPKEAFPTPQQAKQFADAARFYWQHPGEALPMALSESGTWPPPPQTLGMLKT